MFGSVGLDFYWKLVSSDPRSRGCRQNPSVGHAVVPPACGIKRRVGAISPVRFREVHERSCPDGSPWSHVRCGHYTRGLKYVVAATGRQAKISPCVAWVTCLEMPDTAGVRARAAKVGGGTTLGRHANAGNVAADRALGHRPSAMVGTRHTICYKAHTRWRRRFWEWKLV